MKRGVLIVFVKAPVAGRVKTRLARDVGAGRAAALFRVLLRSTFAAAHGPWRTMLAIDPPSAISEFERLWPAAFERAPQSKGDLGARMSAAIAGAGRGPVVIIGADAPAVRARHVRQAFRALGAHDAVFGPAEDGGYWLIGLAGRRAAPHLFERVRWSGPHALEDTLASLPAEFSVAFLETLADIDEGKDLGALTPLSAARPLARD